MPQSTPGRKVPVLGWGTAREDLRALSAFAKFVVVQVQDMIASEKHANCSKHPDLFVADRPAGAGLTISLKLAARPACCGPVLAKTVHWTILPKTVQWTIFRKTVPTCTYCYLFAEHGALTVRVAQMY